MEFSYDSSGDVGMLILNGELTLNSAYKLKRLLIESLEKANNVIIRVEKITEMDISCLQLLCSAHRTAVNLKKILVLNRPGKGLFTDTVKSAGYSRLKACNLGIDKSCLWVGL